MSAFRVLAIEKSEDVRDQLRGILEEGEFELLEAATGCEGLSAARAIVPDLILLDLMLPDLNGFEVIRELKAGRETRRIPVVLLTSLARQVTVLRGAGAWPVEFLSKPIEAEKLFAAIDRQRGAGAAIGRLRALGRAARSSGVAAIDGALTRRLLHRQVAGELESVRREGVASAWLRLEVDMLSSSRTRLDRMTRRELIHEVAERVRESTRVEDLVALDDDAAFIVLLAGVSPLGAQRVAEKIQHSVGEIRIPSHALTISLSSRIDITHWAPSRTDNGESLSEVTQVLLAPRRAVEKSA